MAGSLAASAFFPGPGSSPPSKNTTGELPDNLSVRGIAAKPNPPPGKMQVKAQAQALPKVNGTKVNLKTASLDMEETVPRSSTKTFYNQLPDWSMLLAAITTIFLAAEKQWTLLDWKPKKPDMLVDTFGFGRIVQDGLVFRQNFLIRSYEIGADRTASIETLMNHLQETALNHVKTAGLLGDGFGATPEMSKRNLIWVVSKIQLIVEQYPSWGDMVQVDTWVAASGKNGKRRDWHIRDYNSGRTILKATSVWVMMNKKTRRLSKMPDEVRAEIGPYYNGHSVITDEQSEKLTKPGNKIDGDATKQFIRKGLTPRWSDLDVNQHVNNVKYIGWILESTPISILEKHELASMTLDYRKECGRDSVLQSLTMVAGDCTTDAKQEAAAIQCDHLLQLESGADIVKAHTEWRPKGGARSGSESM
ncbi:palmitoyl-acyl carrier protein thioesterase, chloroplastic-like [Phragmites australis]|uniref:palmitoyl-acyl carrier protein thioesterase, chloroplastic-like n=1 Tax=Phragmites australis TaxID=29695 RepID=UPI002D7A3FE2|nr:palmitoyl-acyl carrier protein thioesterase, chloroplastic-like [Phragmites australis]